MRAYSSIDNVPAGAWDAAAGHALGFDRALLSVSQSGDRHSYAYFVKEHADGATTIATGMTFSEHEEDSPLSDLLLGRLHRRFPMLKRAFGRLLVLRTRFAYRSGIWTGNARSQGIGGRLAEFVDDLQDYADDNDLGILIMDVDETEEDLAAVLRTHSFLETAAWPVARLRVDWSDWQEYIESARERSINAAATIRYETNRARSQGVSMSEWDPETLPEQRLRDLYDAHHRGLNPKGLSYRSGFFTELKRVMGDRVRVLVARRGVALVGSSFVVEGDGEAAVPLLGIDKSKDRGACAYFHLGFYSPIRLAIRKHWRLVTVGTGSYPAKIRRGCHIDAGRAFWRPCSRAVRLFGQPLLAVHSAAFARKYQSVLSARRFSLVQA